MGKMSNGGRGGPGGPGMLERKVAVPYSIMREAAVFVAVAAANNGIGSVRDYVPLLHSALIDLGGFEIAIVTAPVMAPSDGAYTWPNAELRGFASSIADLGVDMTLHTQASGHDRMPASEIRNAGAVLNKFGTALLKMADSTYFCPQYLVHVIRANRPSLELSEKIVGGLAVAALTQSLAGGKGPGDLEHLNSLISAYVGNNAHYRNHKRLNFAGRGAVQ